MTATGDVVRYASAEVLHQAATGNPAAQFALSVERNRWRRTWGRRRMRDTTRPRAGRPRTTARIRTRPLSFPPSVSPITARMGAPERPGEDQS